MSSKRLFDFIGQPGVYVAGPVGQNMDGTSVFATANTLTMAALPFVPEDVQWLGTIMVNADGYSEFPAMEHLHTYAAPLLTIENAEPVFTVASDFLVLYSGPTKAYDTAGYLDVYLRSALTEVNDRVSSRDLAPPEILCGGVTPNSATVGNCTNLTGTSYALKRGVWIRIDPSQSLPAANVTEIVGIHYTSVAGSIITAAGLCFAGRMIRRTGNVDTGAVPGTVDGNWCEEAFIDIDDPSKLYIASNTASLQVVWQGI